MAELLQILQVGRFLQPALGLIRRFFENLRAEGKYRRALRKQYSAVPMPVRIGAPTETLLPEILEIYVEPRIVDESGQDEIDDIWSLLSEAEARRLVVLGPPGSGKSMLLRRVVLASEAAISRAGVHVQQLPRGRLPVLLDLKRVSVGSSRGSLAEHLEGEFRDRIAGGERLFQRARKRGNLVILLDGLDEVDSQHRGGIIQQIRDLMAGEEENHIVVTCRTSGYHSAYFGSLVDRTVRLAELDDRRIQRFLHAWPWPHAPSPQDAERLLAELHKSERMLELARTPLLLTMLAGLYSQQSLEPEQEFPSSRSRLVDQAVEHLLTSRVTTASPESSPLPMIVKRRTLETIALVGRDQGGHGDSGTSSILHETVIEELKRILERESTSPQQGDLLLREIIERSGLLVELDQGGRYEFSHRLLQEYFAARALDEDGMWSRFVADPDGWRESLKLWCGSQHDCTEMLQKVLSVEPQTALECLAEASEVETRLVDRIVDSLSMKLATPDPEDPVVQAFAAAASGPGPGGRAVLTHLERMLRQRRAPMRRKGVINALAACGMPKAASLLIEHYDTTPEVHAALVRMGTPAVPAFAKRAGSGDTDAIDGLAEIATPAAVKSLVDLLWKDDDDYSTATAAAWRLAVIVKDPTVRRAMRAYQISEEYQGAPTMPWLGQPFEELDGQRSATQTQILSQIGDLLLWGPLEAAPEQPPALDVRIAVGLWAVARTRNPSQPYLIASDFLAVLNDLIQIGRMQPSVRRSHRELLAELEESLDKAEESGSRIDADAVLKLLTANVDDPRWEGRLVTAVDYLTRDLSPTEQLWYIARCLPLPTQVKLLARLEVTDSIQPEIWSAITQRRGWLGSALRLADRMRLLPAVGAVAGVTALVLLLIAGVAQTRRTFFESNQLSFENVGWLQALYDAVVAEGEPLVVTAVEQVNDFWAEAAVNVQGWWTDLDGLARGQEMLEGALVWPIPMLIVLGWSCLFFIEKLRVLFFDLFGGLISLPFRFVIGVLGVLVYIGARIAAVVVALLAITMPNIWLHGFTGSWWFVAAFWLLALFVGAFAILTHVANNDDLLRDVLHEFLGSGWYSKDDPLREILELPPITRLDLPSEIEDRLVENTV